MTHKESGAKIIYENLWLNGAFSWYAFMRVRGQVLYFTEDNEWRPIRPKHCKSKRQIKNFVWEGHAVNAPLPSSIQALLQTYKQYEKYYVHKGCIF